MKKPLIWITSSHEYNPDVLNAHKTSISEDYSLAIIEAGGIPVVLPVHDNMEIIKELVGYLDGLLLSGGVDPDPLLFGEDCLQELGNISPERDRFEYMILEEFENTKMPILGI